MGQYYGLKDEHGIEYILDIKQNLLGEIDIYSITPIKPEFPRDRVENHPSGKTEFVLSHKEKKLLYELYMILWSEGYYDPRDKKTEEFCKPLSDIMTELNKTLHFKL
jgi:hypothetical protein